MKLSIENFGLREKVGLFEGCRLIKNAGFDCVDMSYYWIKEEGKELLDDNYIDYAKKLRAHLDEIGLPCNQAHAPFDFKGDAPIGIETPSYLAIVRAIESAAIVGAKAIVVHSIGLGIFYDRQLNLDFYRSLLPYCERAGIAIAVENLFKHDLKRARYWDSGRSAKDLSEFIRELNSPYFVACVDVGHAALTGSEPEDFISEMDPDLIRAVHIQDGDYLADRHALPFLGKYDWKKVMAAFKKAGYDGELNFEIVNFIGPFPNELIADALTLAERVGRHLISLYEMA